MVFSQLCISFAARPLKQVIFRLILHFSPGGKRCRAQLSPKAVGRSVDNMGKGSKEPPFMGPGENRLFFNHLCFIALKQRVIHFYAALAVFLRSCPQSLWAELWITVGAIAKR